MEQLRTHNLNLILIVVFAIWHVTVDGQAYLGRLPEPSVVLERTTDADAYKTAVMQYTTLSCLQAATVYYARLEARSDLFETRFDSYRRALEEIDERVNASSRSGGRNRKQSEDILDRWNVDKQGYDAAFADSVYATYGIPLTMNVIENSRKAQIKEDSAVRAGDDAMDPDSLRKRTAGFRTSLSIMALLPYIALQILCIIMAVQVWKGYRWGSGQAALDVNDSTLFILNDVRLRVQWHTGRAMFVEGWTNSIRESQNGVQTSLEHHEHLKFRLFDTQGKEHPVHLVNSGFDVRNGSLISGAWFVSASGVASAHVLLYNHDQDRHRVIMPNLDPYFPPRASKAVWRALLAILLVVVLGVWSIPNLWKYAPSVVVPAGVLLVVEAALFFLFGFVAILRFGGRRAAQKAAFKTYGAPRIVEYLKDQVPSLRQPI